MSCSLALACDPRRPAGAVLLALLACAPALAQEPTDPSPEPAAHVVVSPADLLPSDGEHELRYAWALTLARRGDLDGAVAALEALATQPLADELAFHVASERERIRCFAQMRTKHLAALAREKGSLRLQLDGRELTFHVSALEADRVLFASTVFGVSSLPLARLDSLQVAKQMPRDLDGDTGRWARLYPYLLEDPERGFHLLRRDCKGSDEAAPLLADAEQWYPSVLELVGAATQLDALAGQPATPESPQAALARIGDLIARHGELEPVVRRMGTLRALATACLQGSFEASDQLETLHGAHEQRDDGSLQLVYEFTDPHELEDFRAAPGYPPERIAVLPALEARDETGVFELSKGELVVAGCRTWRHVLPFRGPISVRCRMRVEAPPRGGSAACFWMLGACDDGHESYVALQEMGTAMAVDRARGYVAYAAAEPGRRLSLDHTYELELACDGETVRTRVDGELVKEVPAGGASHGEVFFLVHSDAAVHFERIEIELAPGGLNESSAWVEARLGELGFPTAPVAEPGAETGVQ